MKRWLFLLLVTLLAACQQTQAPDQPDLLATALLQPGAHISLLDPPPAGYTVVDEGGVIQLYRQGQAIWLVAPPLAQLDAETAAWLRSTRALHFPGVAYDVFWIPTSPAEDTLRYAESLGVTPLLEAGQRRDLWRKRGDALRTQNEFEAAIQAYEQALASDAQDGASYAGLGAAFLGLGRDEEAAAALEKAVALLPDDYWAHRLLGSAYLKLLRWPLALDELTQAYILRPQDSHLLLGVALAQGRMGDTTAALRTLQHLVEISDNEDDLADAALLQAEFTSSP